MSRYRNYASTEYLSWLACIVHADKQPFELKYDRLLAHLHETDFYCLINMDENRAAWGIELRKRFGEERCIEEAAFADHPCSVLEMMIALAISCEENIMDDPTIGDRTAQWFWEMVTNLGLGPMTDKYYDEDYVADVLDRFMERRYSPDGKGGLFYIPDCHYDLRWVEIWRQMLWYLDTIT